MRSVDGGDAAIAACREAAPDVVLLDMQMPGKSGYEVAAEMRADRSLGSFPIVGVTGDVGADAIKRVLMAGCTAHVAKPVSKSILYRTMLQVLGVESEQQDIEEVDSDLEDLIPLFVEDRVHDVQRLLKALEAGDWPQGP